MGCSRGNSDKPNLIVRYIRLYPGCIFRPLNPPTIRNFPLGYCDLLRLSQSFIVGLAVAGLKS